MWHTEPPRRCFKGGGESCTLTKTMGKRKGKIMRRGKRSIVRKEPLKLDAPPTVKVRPKSWISGRRGTRSRRQRISTQQKKGKSPSRRKMRHLGKVPSRRGREFPLAKSGHRQVMKQSGDQETPRCRANQQVERGVDLQKGSGTVDLLQPKDGVSARKNNNRKGEKGC